MGAKRSKGLVSMNFNCCMKAIPGAVFLIRGGEVLDKMFREINYSPSKNLSQEFSIFNA